MWFDPKHTGSLRVLDWDTLTLHGTDPSEPYWKVPFSAMGKDKIRVDFHPKRTHHGRVIMVASYAERRNELRWPDGNVWKRVRADPTPLLPEMRR